MPKEMKDRAPLAPFWTAIRNKNPDLAKNPAFKPDIIGPIKGYDAALATWVKMMAGRSLLAELHGASTNKYDAIADKMDSHEAELDKLKQASFAKLTKTIQQLGASLKDPAVDPLKLVPLTEDWAAEDLDTANIQKSMSDQITKLYEEAAQLTKKFSDEYKKGAADFVSVMKKASDEVAKFETQIRSTIAAYQKVAAKLDKDDLVDAVRSLLDHI